MFKPRTDVSKRSDNGVKWFLAVAGVVLATVAMGYAIFSGQQLKEIRLDGLVFQAPSEAEVKQAQPEIADKVDSLEEQASNQANAEAASASLGGIWWGNNGLRYDIAQYGSNAVITESSDYGITAYGSGVVSGNVFTFDFTAINGVSGSGYLTMSNEGELYGLFESAYGQVEGVLTRTL